MVLKAAVVAGSYWTAALFLGGLGVVFIGILRHAIPLAWGPLPADVTPQKSHWAQGALVFGPLAVLLVLGVWMPALLRNVLTAAAGLLGGPS